MIGDLVDSFLGHENYYGRFRRDLESIRESATERRIRDDNRDSPRTPVRIEIWGFVYTAAKRP
jgi:hypothetical protein